MASGAASRVLTGMCRLIPSRHQAAPPVALCLRIPGRGACQATLMPGPGVSSVP